MPNPRLTPEQHKTAAEILEKIRAEIGKVSNGDPRLKFAFRRRIYKQLEYDERSNPAARKKLKRQMWLLQNKKCPCCSEPLELKDSELDRLDAVFGYEVSNVRLIHHSCHRNDQQRKGFA